jgi:hypothetical protein
MLHGVADLFARDQADALEQAGVVECVQFGMLRALARRHAAERIGPQFDDAVTRPATVGREAVARRERRARRCRFGRAPAGHVAAARRQRTCIGAEVRHFKAEVVEAALDLREAGHRKECRQREDGQSRGKARARTARNAFRRGSSPDPRKMAKIFENRRRSIGGSSAIGVGECGAHMSAGSSTKVAAAGSV